MEIKSSEQVIQLSDYTYIKLSDAWTYYDNDELYVSVKLTYVIEGIKKISFKEIELSCEEITYKGVINAYIGGIEILNKNEIVHEIFNVVKSLRNSGEVDKSVLSDITDGLLEFYVIVKDGYEIIDYTYNFLYSIGYKELPDEYYDNYDPEQDYYDRESSWEEQEYQVGRRLASEGFDVYDEEY